MNIHNLKEPIIHFVTPLKTPVIALSGGLVGLEINDLLSTGTIIAACIILGTILILRSVLYFEFREHEKKEQRLYEAIIITSGSFDNVVTALRRDVYDLTTSLSTMKSDIGKHGATLADHEKRLNLIQSSPLISRVIDKEKL